MSLTQLLHPQYSHIVQYRLFRYRVIVRNFVSKPAGNARLAAVVLRCIAVQNASFNPKQLRIDVNLTRCPVGEITGYYAERLTISCRLCVICSVSFRLTGISVPVQRIDGHTMSA